MCSLKLKAIQFSYDKLDDLIIVSYTSSETGTTTIKTAGLMWKNLWKIGISGSKI